MPAASCHLITNRFSITSHAELSSSARSFFSPGKLLNENQAADTTAAQFDAVSGAVSNRKHAEATIFERYRKHLVDCRWMR